jgi:hypothetical protein
VKLVINFLFFWWWGGQAVFELKDLRRRSTILATLPALSMLAIFLR